MCRAPVWFLVAVSTCLLAGRSAHAQAVGTPSATTAGLGERDDFADRWDVLLVDRGRLILGYGNGKFLGYDVHGSMGNMAVLRPNTRVKFDEVMTLFQHRVMFVAAMHPALLYPDGAGVGERAVFGGTERALNAFDPAEQIDLMAWLIRSGAFARTSEDEAFAAMEYIAYTGAAGALISMVDTNRVSIPVAFRVYEGFMAGRPTDGRLKLRLDRLGVGNRDRANVSARLTLRQIHWQEFHFDTGVNGFLAPLPKSYFQQVTYEHKWLGGVFVGATEPVQDDGTGRDFEWFTGTAVDLINPYRRVGGARFRTGLQLNFSGSERLPEQYFFDAFWRQQLLINDRDAVMQGRGVIYMDGIEYRGAGGEIRANFLLGRPLPGRSSLSELEWDVYSRIYLLLGANAIPDAEEEYEAAIVYVSPLDLDTILERLWLQ